MQPATNNPLEGVMKFENVTDINAPPEVVWSVTEDVERWPEWSPTMESIQRLDEGPFDVGSAARIKQPGRPPAEWRVTELKRGERFAWETRVRGMRMIGTHEVIPIETGTRSRLRIEITGLPVVLFWPLIFLSGRNSLKRENAGLKARCEKLPA